MCISGHKVLDNMIATDGDDGSKAPRTCVGEDSLRGVASSITTPSPGPSPSVGDSSGARWKRLPDPPQVHPNKCSPAVLCHGRQSLLPDNSSHLHSITHRQTIPCYWNFDNVCIQVPHWNAECLSFQSVVGLR
jgi:hypothetical protein